MNARTLFTAAELCACDPRHAQDALATWRDAERGAELAAAAVRAACEAFRANRTPAAQAAYADADRAYDVARFRFQRVSRETVDAVRAIARIARELQLASDGAGRLL